MVKKNKKFTVSIGIPAHNEEANIGNLLRALLRQREDGFVLKEIIVVSDGSTDKTAEKVREIKDARIKLVKNPRRLGQIYSQNIIFASAHSDVVVLFEADTVPEGRGYLSRLAGSLFSGKRAGMVQGSFQAIKSETFLGKVVESQIEVYRKFHKGILWRSSGRGGRAFPKFVYKRLRWPKDVPEDKYALFWCEQRGLEVIYAKEARSFFRCAQDFSDLVKERQKIASGHAALRNYFRDEVVERSYRDGFRLGLKMALYFFLKNPLKFACYVALKLAVWARVSKKEFSDLWPPTLSTKTLTLNYEE